MQHSHHIWNNEVNLNLTADTAFYHTPVITHALQDVVIIPVISNGRQILKVEYAAGGDQKDNCGKCDQQIGGTIQLNDVGLPLPCARKVHIVRHSVF